MGIFDMLGGGDEGGYDLGTRLALAGQVLSAMDQGQTANIAPAIAQMSARRREIADEMKQRKWLQGVGASIAERNPELGKLLSNPDMPVGMAGGLLQQYYQTMLAPPEWKTFESQGDVYRYNPNDPNSKPEVFFDGPDDPFKQMLQSINPAQAAPTPGQPPQAGPQTPAPGGELPGMPQPPEAAGGAPGQPAALTPQQRMLADTVGLPPDATPEEIQAVIRAGSVGGLEQAMSVAKEINERRKASGTQKLELDKETRANAFKLQDDYWRVGQTYKKITDTADEIAALPDDPGSFERLVTMYKFMRTLDPMGAVREGDAALAQNAAGIISQIDQVMSKYSGAEGGDIPLEAAREMKRLVLQLGETAAQADWKTRQKVLRRAKALGIPQAEEVIFGGLSDEVDMSGYTPRYEVPARKGDKAPEPGAPPEVKASDWLDPADMVEGKQYIGDDGKTRAVKRNGKIWLDKGDGKGFQEMGQ